MKIRIITAICLFIHTCIGATFDAHLKIEATPSHTHQKIIPPLYFKLFEQIEQPSYWGERWMLSKRTNCLAELFGSLDIQLTAKEMLEVFKQNKVLQHRPLDHSKLILGCGNVPAYRPEVQAFFIDNYSGSTVEAACIYRKKHSHLDADTLDPDFARDPTIVGEIGKISVDVFKGHRYSEIEIEGIILMPWEVTREDQRRLCNYIKNLETCIALLKEDGVLIDNDRRRISKKELISRREYYRSIKDL